MRDPARIDPIIDALRAMWKRNPDMRLGQLFHAVTYSDPRDPFYLEDDVWLRMLTKRETDWKMADPLTAIRAEVERMRDDALVKSRNMDGAAEHIGDAMREQSRAYARAYARVLDLIDKHTRMTLDDIPPGI